MKANEKRAIEKLLNQIKTIREELSPAMPIQQVQLLLEIALNEGQSHKALYEKLAPLSSASTARGIRELSERSWKSNEEGTRRREGFSLISSEPDPMELRVKRCNLTNLGKSVISKLAK